MMGVQLTKSVAEPGGRVASSGELRIKDAGVPWLFIFPRRRTTELKPRIVVFGVGGAGGNAVNNMIEAGLEGVEFVVANTDAQQLAFSKTDRRIQLGVTVTQGLGAGAHPEIGMSAAEESGLEIGEHLDGAHMVFITAGMGGGTGTGAAPIIAKCARERGILTVGVVTKPFTFEGRHRMRLADAGIAELQRYVDTLIVIPNQNLFRIANERTTFAEAFGMADQVLHSGVRSITDLMVLPGLINLDFADVRTVMTEMGKAMMGTGEATGEDRALMASQNAIANPLLDEVSLKGAKAVLVNVTGGLDMTLLEVDEAANAISEQVDPGSQHHLRRRLRSVAGRQDPRVGGRHRHGRPVDQRHRAQAGARPPPPPSRCGSRTRAATARRSRPRPRCRCSPSPWPSRRRGRVAAPQPEPAPADLRTAAEAEPAVEAEPVRQGDLYAEPSIIQPEQRTAARAARVEDEAPLFADRPLAEDHKHQKGGWLSLFGGGRARHDSPPPLRDYRGDPTPVLQARAAAVAAQSSAQPALEEQPDLAEDLEIPSFLRRLAN